MLCGENNSNLLKLRSLWVDKAGDVDLAIQPLVKIKCIISNGFFALLYFLVELHCDMYQ